MQVFLSYARADASKAADELRQQLVNARQVTWLDRENIPGGADWKKSAAEAIVGCTAFVLLITPEAMRSEHVAFEYQLALALRKPFFPALVLPAALPADLANLNYRDLAGPNYTTGLTKLLGDLDVSYNDARTALGALLTTHPAVRQELRPTVTQALQFADSKIKPPEVFLAFREVLANMTADPRPLPALLNDFLTHPPAAADPWPRNVIAAHWSFFEIVLEPLRQQLSPAAQGDPIPIVLVVMTRAEADELESGAALANAPVELKQQFARLRAGVLENPPEKWVERYGPTSEDWIPYDGSPALGAYVRAELQKVPGAAVLYPHFLDVRTLNTAAARSTLKQLRHEGCLVIVDELSICHPDVHQAYLRTMLCSHQRVMLVHMSSFGSVPELAEITLSFKKRLDLEFWDRYKLDRDINCKRIGEDVDFQRFLAADLINTLPPEKRPATGVHEFIKGR
jgi:hypothetical protein